MSFGAIFSTSWLAKLKATFGNQTHLFQMSALGSTMTFSAAGIQRFGTLTETGSGVLSYDDGTGTFTALIDCYIYNVNWSFLAGNTGTSSVTQILPVTLDRGKDTSELGKYGHVTAAFFLPKDGTFIISNSVGLTGAAKMVLNVLAVGQK